MTLERSMHFDYVFIRDQGITHLLPYIRYLSDETLLIVLCGGWSSVPMEQRVIVRDEMARRYPDVNVTIGTGWRPA